MMMDKLKNKLKTKGEIDMKTQTNLLELNGVQTPDLNEPKGELFEKKVNEAKDKADRLRTRVNHSISERKKIETEIQKIRHALIIEEDSFEIMELKNKRRDLEETLQSAEDLTGINVNEYAKGMLETDELKALYEEARAEYTGKSTQATEYEKKLNARYQESVKEIYRFNAGYKSDSHFRKASVYYHHTKNG